MFAQSAPASLARATPRKTEIAAGAAAGEDPAHVGGGQHKQSVQIDHHIAVRAAEVE